MTTLSLVHSSLGWPGLSRVILLLVSVGAHSCVIGQLTGWLGTGWSRRDFRWDGRAVLHFLTSARGLTGLWTLVLGARPTPSLPGWERGALLHMSCYSECPLRIWSRQRPPGKGRQTWEDPGAAEVGGSEAEECSAFLQAGQAALWLWLSAIAQEERLSL